MATRDEQEDTLFLTLDKKECGIVGIALSYLAHAMETQSELLKLGVALRLGQDGVFELEDIHGLSEKIADAIEVQKEV